MRTVAAAVRSGLKAAVRRAGAQAQVALAGSVMLVLASAPAVAQDDAEVLARRVQALQIELTNRLSSIEQSLRFVTDLAERIQRDQRRSSDELQALVNDLRVQVADLQSGVPLAANPGPDPAGEAEDGIGPGPASPEGQLGVLIRPVDESGTIPEEAASAAEEDPSRAQALALLERLQVPEDRQETADEQFEAARDLLRDGFLEDAAARFQGFVDAYPDDPRVADAWYWIGEAQLGLNRLQAAAAAHLTVVREYGDSNRAPDSLLRVGMTLARQGNDDEACNAFNLVGTLYPDASERLKTRVARELRDAGCGS